MEEKLIELLKRWSSQLKQMENDMTRICSEKRVVDAAKIANSQTRLIECVNDIKLIVYGTSAF